MNIKVSSTLGKAKVTIEHFGGVALTGPGGFCWKHGKKKNPLSSHGQFDMNPICLKVWIEMLM